MDKKDGSILLHSPYHVWCCCIFIKYIQQLNFVHECCSRCDFVNGFRAKSSDVSISLPKMGKGASFMRFDCLSKCTSGHREQSITMSDGTTSLRFSPTHISKRPFSQPSIVCCLSIWKTNGSSLNRQRCMQGKVGGDDIFEDCCLAMK